MTYNKVILAGNLTRDPELRFTPKGAAVCKLGLALNRSWTQDGQKREEVTFVDVDAFGKQAEAIGQYFKKGRGILLEGRLKLDQWDDKQTGQKRSRLGVVLESFTFVDSNKAGEVEPPDRRQQHADTTPKPADEKPQGDDVPF